MAHSFRPGPAVQRSRSALSVPGPVTKIKIEVPRPQRPLIVGHQVGQLGSRPVSYQPVPITGHVPHSLV
jgi:hypothetical protein